MHMMNQGSSSGSWQVASPTFKMVKRAAVSPNLQAKLRPWVPLIRTVNTNTKGPVYFPCRAERHAAAGATIKLTMPTAMFSVVTTVQAQEPIH
eukprot:scaffold21000_cov64-Phaeocystis_antarctica.AAC.3